MVEILIETWFIYWKKLWYSELFKGFSKFWLSVIQFMPAEVYIILEHFIMPSDNNVLLFLYF